MNTPLLQLIGQIVTVLVSSGAIAAWAKGVVDARARKRDSDGAEKRPDIATQNGLLLVCLIATREVAIAAGIDPRILPALPAFLKEPA